MIALGLFGDAVDSDDGVVFALVVVALSFPFALSADTLAASQRHSLSPLAQDRRPVGVDDLNLDAL